MAEEESKVEELQTEEESREIVITEEELNTLKQEVEEFKQKYINLLAESENARKRMQKEREEHKKYAVESMIVDFLQPLDQLDQALQFTDQMSAEVSHWAMGFKMILQQFKDALSSQGVESFDSVGKMFCPHRHEAMETAVTEEIEEGTIIEEFVRGYKMGERVIRPARVKVAKAPKVEESDSKENKKTNAEETKDEQ